MSSTNSERKRRRIGVDIDGVLAQFALGIWPHICAAAGRSEPFRDPSGWMNWSPFTDDEFLAGFRAARACEGFWSGLPAYTENTHALLSFLIAEQDTFDVLYVTSRPETEYGVLKETNEWLEGHLLTSPATSTIVVTDPAFKPALMRACGVYAWIDDHLPTVLDGLRDAQRAYLLDRPWNGEGEGRPAMIREYAVKSLKEFLDRVRR